MQATQTIFLILATSLNRRELLLNRSLFSVYQQQGIDGRNVRVLVIDDNDCTPDESTTETKHLTESIMEFRQKLQLSSEVFHTQVLPNIRRKHHSGTGAWNTGIRQAYQLDPNSFIAILDDDDEYLPNHLYDCLEVLRTQQEVKGVFQELLWQLPDGTLWPFPLQHTDLTPESFFIGNPGIQSSNMFIKTQLLIDIDGFDESLHSATDRDLMIRLLMLNRLPGNKVHSHFQIIHNPGVIHHFHDGQRITTNRELKQKGLDAFYEKHMHQFSEEAFKISLKRASFLFNYEHSKIYE